MLVFCHRMSEKPSPLKSPVPMAFQLGPGLGVNGPTADQAGPVHFQIEAWPCWRSATECRAGVVVEVARSDRVPARPGIGAHGPAADHIVPSISQIEACPCPCSEKDARRLMAAAPPRPRNKAAVGDLEHRAASPLAAVRGCAEQVAVVVDNQAGFGGRGAIGSRRSTSDGRAGVTGGGLVDLEHRAVAGDSSGPAVCRCRAEQVAVGVGDQAGRRRLPSAGR